jgi:hypothetical protein
MKWTIRVELTPDGNPPITYDIGTITRPIADLSPEQIGLTLEEGQQLLRRIQVEIIRSQAHAYALCRRACVDCGRPKRIKDIRTKCVQTVFGASDFGVAGIGPVAAATILSDFAKTSRSVKSFRGGQRRRCAICSPSLPLGCRIGRHPAYLRPVDSAKCVQAIWRFGVTRSL